MRRRRAWEERHGEQNDPSPLHTPARGSHAIGRRGKDAPIGMVLTEPRGPTSAAEPTLNDVKQPLLAVVAYFNLVGAAITVPLAIATGLGAWRWQLEGARLKGNLELHLICGLTSAALILVLCLIRSRLRAKGDSPRAAYFAIMALGLIMVTLTGHLGGIVSGLETP